MTTCPNCKKQLENDAKYCDVCGTKIVKTIFCPSCGKQTSLEFKFCQSCGASLSQQKTSASENTKKKSRFKPSPKVIAIGGACIALVLVAVLALSLLGNSGRNNNFALYLKDGEMYYTDLSKIEPWKVTARLIDEEGSIDNEELAEYAYAIGNLTHLSDDGKILFYVDKISEDSEGASLFYRYVNETKEEPVKIDSDVRLYSVSDSGKYVTYLKGEEGILYQHNLIDKEKIDEEVSKFEVSDDGKKIGYLDNEENLYLKCAGKDKEKIDSDVSYISYINDDFNTIYYIKEGVLYKKVEGGEKEKIASDVSSVIKVYESGEIYYTKKNSDENSLLDYVEDDMKESDLAIEEPGFMEYPSYGDYDSDEEYKAAYEKAYEMYQQKWDAYYDKQERDELRKDLDGEPMTISIDTLCYYNGKKETILADTCIDLYSSNAASNRPLVVYSKYNQTTDAKVKLSEIEDIYQARTLVRESVKLSAETYVAIKDKATIVARTDAQNCNINDAGNTLYFFSNVDESQHGDLYKVNISSDKVKKAELYDSEVCEYFAYFVTDDKYVYSKNVKDYTGDIYVNKESIDYDVEIHGLIYDDEADVVMYLNDWNDDKNYGTLKMYRNGKSVKIADDVSAYDIAPNGEIIYLYNYSNTHHQGELFLYKNGESEKIDDDVIGIIHIFNLKYKNILYYN